VCPPGTSLSESAEFRYATSMHGYQNRSVLSHPPGMKPQRPLNYETKQLLQMHNYIYNIHSQLKRTLTDIHLTQKIHAGKTASVYIKNGKCLFVQGCSQARPVTRSRLLLLLSTHRFSSILADLLLKRYHRSFYMRGLFELFPPIYLPYSITLNGLSSPLSRSRSQPYKTLKAYLPMPMQRHGSMAQHPKQLNYIQFKF
jgi:hypothetical protein